MSRHAGSIAEANALLVRAIDLLHVELAGHVESVALLKLAGDELIPDLGQIDDADLIAVDSLFALVIEIEDHLALPDQFEACPYWLRILIEERRERRALRQAELAA